MILTTVRSTTQKNKPNTKKIERERDKEKKPVPMGDMPSRELEQSLHAPGCSGEGGWLIKELTQEAATTEHLPKRSGVL